MKRKFSTMILFVITFFVFNLGLQVQAQAQKDISHVVIKPEIALTPEIQSGTTPSLASPAKWIQISIDFTTILKNTKMGRDYFEWIDNIRVEVELILPTGHSQKTHVLLLGKTDYWFFALDGKEHHVVMFVPPDILKRWAPAQKFSNAEVKKLEVKAVFKRNDAVIAAGFYAPRGKNEVEVAKRFSTVASLPEFDRIRNGVYSIDKTPWAHLNFDYYELVKTTKLED